MAQCLQASQWKTRKLGTHGFMKRSLFTISLAASTAWAHWCGTLLVALLCAGCAAISTPVGTTPGSPASAPVLERPSAGAPALRQGVAAFDLGEYRLAENKLAAAFQQGLSNTPDILRGYKTQAFVYCVTARTALCEKSFAAAFSIDKKFNLTAGERQHPVWGPVFAKVQKRYMP
jgi:hypothetical protein